MVPAPDDDTVGTYSVFSHICDGTNRSDDLRRISLSHNRTALVFADANRIRLRLRKRGSFAYIGVCKKDFKLEQAPLVEGCISLDSGGTLVDNGCGVTAHHARWEEDDSFTMCLGNDGALQWSRNGEEQPAVTNLRCRGFGKLVFCVGSGIGTGSVVWDLG